MPQVTAIRMPHWNTCLPAVSAVSASRGRLVRRGRFARDQPRTELPSPVTLSDTRAVGCKCYTAPDINVGAVFVQERHALFTPVLLARGSHKLLGTEILPISFGIVFQHTEVSLVAACPGLAEGVSLKCLRKNALPWQLEGAVSEPLQGSSGSFPPNCSLLISSSLRAR